MKIQIFIFLVAVSVLGKDIEKTTEPKLKQWEVRTAPIAYIARWITLDVSYRFNEQFAAGPAIVVYNSESTTGGMFSPTYKGTAFGAQAYYYFRSVMGPTWYIGSRFYKEDYRSYPHAFSGYDNKDGWSANATLGYQVRSPSTVWLFGIGPEATTHNVLTHENNKPTVEDSESFFGLAIEFKVGFDF